MAPVAESIYVPNDPSCREYLRSQRPQLQTVFSHPETCVWGRVGYFLVPRELSERIGVMRVKKKGEWTKNGVPKNLLRHKEPGQKLGTGLTTRPRARARAPRARRCLERRDFAPNLGGETPVAESIYVPNDPSCREYLRSQRPQLQTVFSHPETCVWGRVGYFLVPRELSERIGVMRVKKKGEWTKSGVTKNLLRRKEPGQKLGTGLTTRPRARARRARAALPGKKRFRPQLGWGNPSCREYLRSQRPQLQRVFTFPSTPVAESIYVPNDPSC